MGDLCRYCTPAELEALKWGLILGLPALGFLIWFTWSDRKLAPIRVAGAAVLGVAGAAALAFISANIQAFFGLILFALGLGVSFAPAIYAVQRPNYYTRTTIALTLCSVGTVGGAATLMLFSPSALTFLTAATSLATTAILLWSAAWGVALLPRFPRPDEGKAEA